MDGPGLDPRGMTETRAGGGGQTPPQGPCDPLEVRNPKPQPSSGVLCAFSVQPPKAHRSPAPGASQALPWCTCSLGCPAHLPEAEDATPSLPASIQHWVDPPLRDPSRDSPAKGVCHKTPGLPGETKDNQKPQPKFCPAVQGSSGHQLWAPRSIWIEETMEGTEPGRVLLRGKGAL